MKDCFKLRFYNFLPYSGLNKSRTLLVFSTTSLRLCFCSDVDIPLTEKGVMEALSGGRTIKDVDFDIVFTSRLLRAKQTAMLALTQVSYLSSGKANVIYKMYLKCKIKLHGKMAGMTFPLR
jgi:bisphosphoglycerate-dependent phosphoglycerate mutase